MENSYSFMKQQKTFKILPGVRNLKRSMRIPLGNLQIGQGKSLLNIRGLIVIQR